MKGIEVKSNQLTKTMLRTVLDRSYEALKNGDENNVSDGWILLVQLLVDAYLTSRRNPLANCTTRKVKALEEYVERCRAPHVRLMRRTKEDRKFGDFISFTYILTDVSQKSNDEINPIFVEDLDENHHVLNFEKLFKSQHSEILNLLNLGFFKEPNFKTVMKRYRQLIELIKWKQIVNSSITCLGTFGEQPIILVLKGVKYAFKIC